VLGLISLAPNLQRMAVDETGMARDLVDVGVRQVAVVPGIDAADVGLAPPHQLAPVQRAALQGETVVRGHVHGVGDLGGIPHYLLGHAAHIDAGAAEATGLDHGAAGTVAGCPLGNRQSAAATADGDQIVLLAHADSECRNG